MTANFSSHHGRVLSKDGLHTFETITVSIGTEGLMIQVYEALIRKSSVFFDNALKPEWAASRADPGVIDLTDEDPIIFKTYLNWLYFKTIPTVLTENSALENPEYETLNKCYVMGEKLLDENFQGAILGAFSDAMKNQPFYNARFPGSNAINIIYAGTTDNSPARRLLVDTWTANATAEWAQYIDETMPPTSTQDLLKALLTSKTKATVSALVPRWKRSEMC